MPEHIDPDHPAMRMIFAMYDAALEFGLTRAEVGRVVEEATAKSGPDDPIATAIIDALAVEVDNRGESGEAFRQHVAERTAPLAREARTVLGMEEQ